MWCCYASSSSSPYQQQQQKLAKFSTLALCAENSQWWIDILIWINYIDSTFRVIFINIKEKCDLCLWITLHPRWKWDDLGVTSYAALLTRSPSTDKNQIGPHSNWINTSLWGPLCLGVPAKVDTHRKVQVSNTNAVHFRYLGVSYHQGTQKNAPQIARKGEVWGVFWSSWSK